MSAAEEEADIAEEELAGEEAAGYEGEGEGEADQEELEAMKNQIKDMEDEAEKLRKIQEQVEEEIQDTGEGGEQTDETDGRSIYVGNVDYSTTPEDLQEFFAGCGTVNRVTILCDKFRNPKGFSYVEFAEPDAVENAVALSETDFKGRPLKVVAKRKNVPGKGKGKGKGRGRGRGPPAWGYGKG